MNSDSTKLGDVVRLKSGGPAMTVTYISDEGKLQCEWFTDAVHGWKEFPREAVEQVEVDLSPSEAEII